MSIFLNMVNILGGGRGPVLLLPETRKVNTVNFASKWVQHYIRMLLFVTLITDNADRINFDACFQNKTPRVLKMRGVFISTKLLFLLLVFKRQISH